MRDARCQFDGDGPFWLGDPAVPASCADRVREAAQANVSWMSVERWLDLPLCGELQYAVALRAPVARALHQFIHMLCYFYEYYDMQDHVDVLAILQGVFAKLWRFDRVRGQMPGRLPPEPAGGWAAVSELHDLLDVWLGFAGNYQDIYIYIYIERERERQRVCIYIYIYV